MEAKDFSTGNEKLRIKLGEYDSFEARVQPIVFLFVRLSSNWLFRFESIQKFSISAMRILMMTITIRGKDTRVSFAVETIASQSRTLRNAVNKPHSPLTL